jgi:hypothetical protein
MFEAIQNVTIKLLGTMDLPMSILLMTMILLVCTLTLWHRADNDFDFRRALLDPETKVISFSRLGHFVCLVASTALLMHEAAKGRLTDWMFMGYMTAWAGTYVASKAIASKIGQ